MGLLFIDGARLILNLIKLESLVNILFLKFYRVAHSDLLSIPILVELIIRLQLGPLKYHDIFTVVKLIFFVLFF